MTKPTPSVTVANRAVGDGFDAYINGLLCGSRWDISGALAPITFSFPQAQSNYGAATYGSGEATTGQWQGGFNTVQQNCAIWHLQNYANACGITFQQFTETDSAHATIRFANTALTSTAWAYLPSSSSVLAGDTWFNINVVGSNPTPGSYGWMTMGHELGHAVGLKHPHDPGSNGVIIPTTPADPLSSCIHNTIMSYSGYLGHTVPNGGLPTSNGSYPRALSVWDAAAVQHMYGINTAFRSTGATRLFDQNTSRETVNGVLGLLPVANKMVYSTWDGGGTGILDCSANTDCTLDINPLKWCTVNPAHIGILNSGVAATNSPPGCFCVPFNPNSPIKKVFLGSGKQIFRGNTVDNTIVVGLGTTNVIDGVTGTNTVVLSGRKVDYRFNNMADGSWWVVDLRAATKNRTCNLRNVTTIQCSDLVRPLTNINDEGFVTRIGR